MDDEVRRYKEGQAATRRGDGPVFPSGDGCCWGFEPRSRAAALEQEAVRLKPSVDRNNYGPFLLMLNPDKLAVITLHVVIGQLMKGEESFSPSRPSRHVQVRCRRAAGRSRAGGGEPRGSAEVAGAAAAAPAAAGGGDEVDWKTSGDLAEDVTDVEDFIAKPHLADRFARVNAKSLRDLTSVRSVAKFARSALNDSDWGSTVRAKVGAALTNLLLNTARVKVPGPGEGGEDLLGSRVLPRLHVPQGPATAIPWHEAFYGFMDDEHMIRATLSRCGTCPWSRRGRGRVQRRRVSQASPS